MYEREMASTAAEFWAKRRELSPAPTGNDAGRRLVLLADVPGADNRPAYERVTSMLGEFDCLTPSAFEALHLAVKRFDIAVDDATTETDAVEQVNEAVTDAVAATDPFDIEFTQFDLFPDVVYAELEAGGRLADLNRRLCAHSTTLARDRDLDGFVPHLTLGHLTGDSDYDTLATFLEANRGLDLPRVSIDSVCLAVLGTGE